MNLVVLLVPSLLFCGSESNAVIDAIVGPFAPSALWESLYYLKCKYTECCDADNGWLLNDFVGLSQDLNKYLYGQHLAKEAVMKSLEHHYKNEHPEKALVLSFHGPVGTGKTYVSNMIVKRLYKKGFESDYVKLWICKMHFPQENYLELYTQEIKRVLREKVSACPRALFVFDEMDLIVPGVIDTLKPYLDYHGKVDGIDYRKATFIFMSNTGAKNITALASKYKFNKKNRQDITMKDIRPLIENGAFNEKGGLKRAALIKNSLIDIYVPFLPLERQHVKACIYFFLDDRGCSFTSRDVEKIANQITYTDTHNYFVKNGCKLLQSLIAQIYYNPCIRNKSKFK